MFLALGARADLIVVQNDFLGKLLKEKGKLEIVYRSFYANGADGFVLLKEQPDAEDDIGKIENGRKVTIEGMYNHDGTYWGFSRQFCGWVLMDELLVIYDRISFEEEHKEEFYEYAGGYEKLKSAGRIVIWTWPCSGEISTTWDAKMADDDFAFDCAYRDEEGREWGRMGDCWICIDDAANINIPAVEKPAAGYFGHLLVFVIVLVGAVALFSAVLIMVFWKPNKAR